MKTSLIALSAAAVFAAGGLMSAPAHAANEGNPERLALAVKHAGEPVETATFFPRKKSRSAFSNAWEVLSEEQLLVWNGKDEAWLVDLKKSAACRTLDGDFEVKISGSFYALKTKSYIDYQNGTCRIEQIRPVDVAAMKAEEAGETGVAKS